MNRNRALICSLVLTIFMNSLAGLVTLAYANGRTIIETNPSNNYLLGELGAVTIIIRAVEIATLYPMAYLLSRAISSKQRVLSAKRIYLFTFSLLIALLPAAAFTDVISDVLVVSLGSNLLAGAERILAVGLGVAIPFAGYQAARKWTLISTQ